MSKVIIEQFYTAFQNHDYATMQNCYHPNAKFYDPVFQNLNSKEVKAMWQMLLISSKDLKITFKDVEVNETTATCIWEADYTFSQTNREVHNVIYSTFKFEDGKILDHHDEFSLWRWAAMALGLRGWLLGWSPIVKNKIRQTAQGRLRKFMTTL